MAGIVTVLLLGTLVAPSYQLFQLRPHERPIIVPENETLKIRCVTDNHNYTLFEWFFENEIVFRRESEEESEVLQGRDRFSDHAMLGTNDEGNLYFRMVISRASKEDAGKWTCRFSPPQMEKSAEILVVNVDSTTPVSYVDLATVAPAPEEGTTTLNEYEYEYELTTGGSGGIIENKITPQESYASETALHTGGSDDISSLDVASSAQTDDDIIMVQTTDDHKSPGTSTYESNGQSGVDVEGNQTTPGGTQTHQYRILFPVVFIMPVISVVAVVFLIVVICAHCCSMMKGTTAESSELSQIL